MPGFNIQIPSNLRRRPASERAEPTREYYYTYTWSVPLIVGENTYSNPALIHLKEATTPTFQVEQERYIGASLVYHYAKSIAWQNITLTWYDTTGLIDYIIKWRKSIWTYEDGLKAATSYKKDTRLECSLPTDQGEYYGWKLINSWPSQIRSGELTYTSSDVKVVKADITYDWADELTGFISGDLRQRNYDR